MKKTRWSLSFLREGQGPTVRPISVFLRSLFPPSRGPIEGPVGVGLRWVIRIPRDVRTPLLGSSDSSVGRLGLLVSYHILHFSLLGSSESADSNARTRLWRPDLWAINRGGQGGHLLWPSDSDCSLAHRIPRLTPHRTPLLGSSDSSFNTPSDSLCSTPSLAPVSLHGQGHRCRTAPVRGLDDMSTCHFRPTLGAYYSGGAQVRHVGGAKEADPHGRRYRRRSSTAA